MGKTKSMVRMLAMVAALSTPSASVNAQKSSSASANTREVNVYYVYETSGGPLVSGELYSIVRWVSKRAPLQAALKALVEGPTSEVANLGYQSPAYAEGMKLASAKIKRGIAYAYFTRPPMPGNPPDMASLRFEEAVVKTAKQFPTVRKVVVCVNGIMEFGIGLVEGAPSPCPKEIN
jgi:spore germination protein GerM